MTYATASDVAIRLGRDLTAEEVTLVAIRLDDVERRIKRRIPDLDAVRFPDRLAPPVST